MLGGRNSESERLISEKVAQTAKFISIVGKEKIYALSHRPRR
jgi:hypothetical protein